MSRRTPAAERGLKPGDVIMEVQQGEVASPADIQKQVDAARKADRKFVLMLIQRRAAAIRPAVAVESGSKDKQPG